VLRSLAGGALFGEVWGTTPARVLALHGWARSHGDFAPVFDGAGLDVVAPDLPGFGATPAPPVAWGSDDYARALEGLFAAGRGEEGGAGGGPLLRAPAVLLGHSFGGRVALRLAAARPHLVAALVLTGVPLLPRPGARRRPPLAFRALRTLGRAHLVSEARLEAARRRYGSSDYRNAEGVVRGVLVRVLSEEYETSLRALRCPLELVWADDDTEAPLSVATGIAALVPGAVITRCGSVGHLTPLSAPAALRAAVERALLSAA
jgi:pimeloyl-ACP methyl ester carboxylesterase